MLKHCFTFLLFCCIVFTHCRTVNKAATASSIGTEIFTIDTERDTALKTSKGAIIKIAAGSFKGNTSNVLKLEVREVYSISDMVKAGLTTLAGNEPLMSGGMFSVLPYEDQGVSIVKPISFSVPTDRYLHGMQLYKGAVSDNGKIDWQNPQPLKSDIIDSVVRSGEAIFTNNCASCHNGVKDATGPALAFAERRLQKEWIYAFVRNSAALIAAHNRYANCIYEEWNKAQMPAYPNLTDGNIDAIFEYLSWKYNDYDPTLFYNRKKALDSCATYERLYTELTSKRKAMIDDNGYFAKVEHIAQITNDTTGFIKKESPINKNAVYYEASITTFGWYNIDILIKNLPGFQNSELIVNIVGQFKGALNLYFVLPNEKILLPGFLLNGSDNKYRFYNSGEAIPLPQNVRAYIIAIGEQEKELYFDIETFFTSKAQYPNIQLAVSNAVDLEREISKLDIKDFNVKVGASKNAVSIAGVDSALSAIELLKPTSYNCKCGMADDRDSVSNNKVISESEYENR